LPQDGGKGFIAPQSPLAYPNRRAQVTLAEPMTMQAAEQNVLTRGTVLSASEGRLILGVDGTNYQLHLDCPASLVAGQSVQGSVVVRARKIWTIPAGGCFIAPISGPSRVVQGRVKAVNGRRLMVQAGTAVCIELPEDRSACDLKNGELVPGVMVNITTFQGARFEPAAP